MENEIATLISQVGFPIVMCLILVLRIEKKLERIALILSEIERGINGGRKSTLEGV